jgi:hypothetical protein
MTDDADDIKRDIEAALPMLRTLAGRRCYEGRKTTRMRQ